MADTLTTNFGFVKPQIGASADTWGSKLNDNWDSIDNIAGAVRSSFLPVLVATTANITLAGEQTIDGVLTSVSRVLVKNQTSPADNGIYVTAAGSWMRAQDANATDEFIRGRDVFVQQGTVNGGKDYRLSSSVISLGTSDVTFSDAIKQGTATLGALTSDSLSTGAITASGASSLQAVTATTVDATGNTSTGGNHTITGDLTVNGGDVILGGTGRIQGVDTVTDPTDATSKAYVDARVNPRLVPIAAFSATSTTKNADMLDNVIIVSAQNDIVANVFRYSIRITGYSFTTANVVVVGGTEVGSYYITSASGDQINLACGHANNAYDLLGPRIAAAVYFKA